MQFRHAAYSTCIYASLKFAAYLPCIMTSPCINDVPADEVVRVPDNDLVHLHLGSMSQQHRTIKHKGGSLTGLFSYLSFTCS